MENGDGPLPTTWQEFELMFRATMGCYIIKIIVGVLS